MKKLQVSGAVILMLLAGCSQTGSIKDQNAKTQALNDVSAAQANLGTFKYAADRHIVPVDSNNLPVVENWKRTFSASLSAYVDTLVLLQQYVAAENTAGANSAATSALSKVQLLISSYDTDSALWKQDDFLVTWGQNFRQGLASDAAKLQSVINLTK